jgi:hypothetical protein
MKIFEKIAIDPKSFTSIETFYLIMGQINLNNGLILVQFPKNWARRVLDHLSKEFSLDGIKRTQVVSMLHQIKKVKTGKNYYPDKEWSVNINEIISNYNIDKFITRDASTINTDKSFICSTNELAEMGFFSFFNVENGIINLKNSPDELLKPAKPLLEMTSQAVFIDPYFAIYNGNETKYSKTLVEFAKFADKHNKCKMFIICTSNKKPTKNPEVNLEKYFYNLLSFLPQGFSIRVMCLENIKGSSFKVHARFFLTDGAGIKYDKGFGSEKDPDYTDVTRISEKNSNDLYDQYITNVSQCYEIIYDYTWER